MQISRSAFLFIQTHNYKFARYLALKEIVAHCTQRADFIKCTQENAIPSRGNVSH